jgi:hypothetical protein
MTIINKIAASLLIVGLSFASVGHAADVITACVKNGNGNMRIVSGPGQCKPDNEVELQWNVEGPPGEAGPLFTVSDATYEVLGSLLDIDRNDWRVQSDMGYWTQIEADTGQTDRYRGFLFFSGKGCSGDIYANGPSLGQVFSHESQGSETFYIPIDVSPTSITIQSWISREEGTSCVERPPSVGRYVPVFPNNQSVTGFADFPDSGFFPTPLTLQ